MIIVLAAYLGHRAATTSARWARILGALLLAVPLVALVLIQPDLGTSMVFVAILVGTLFMTGGSLRWLLGFAGLGLAALPVVWTVVLRDYQKARLLSFLDPSADPLGTGYQLIQSQIAVGSGGIFGKGLANATQAPTDSLPVQTTDFVFALLAQQLGFIGVIVVLVAFGALLWRILRIGWRSDDTFGLAFAAGMASMLLFQLFVNVGHGHRHHAHHRHPDAVRDLRRRVARSASRWAWASSRASTSDRPNRASDAAVSGGGRGPGATHPGPSWTAGRPGAAAGRVRPGTGGRSAPDPATPGIRCPCD